jgi:hypothetical protein
MGELTVTVASGAVNLQGPSFPDTTATGTLQAVTITDTRNYRPGWSVSAQVSDFAGSGSAAGLTIPADQLGWVPAGTLASGAVLGAPVQPGSPGLASAAVLASAAAGQGTGTSRLSADLTLEVPLTIHEGPYTGTMTITFITTGP